MHRLLFTPFLRRFSISLVKEDSSLDKNFISIGLFSREKSSSQISKGIPCTVDRASELLVSFFQSDNQVDIEPTEKKVYFLSQASF